MGFGVLPVQFLSPGGVAREARVVPGLQLPVSSQIGHCYDDLDPFIQLSWYEE